MTHRIKQSYTRYNDGRKQGHFSYMHTFRVPPSSPYFCAGHFNDLIPLLPFWLCFDIVSSYCFTSEIQKLWNPLPPIRSCTYAFWITPPSHSPAPTPSPHHHQLRTYLMHGPFLNVKTYKNIQIWYSLKYKTSNK